MDDHTLLQEYRLNQSDAAFAQLVKRHLEFVYGTALRLTRDPRAAEDVTQTVFIQLARKAGGIQNGHTLMGWLYRTTQRTFLMSRREEARRRRREWEAILLAEQNQDEASRWEQMAPLLDEALRRLSRAEQDAILLHYFQDKPYHEVAVLLGMNKSAVHKRVTRAVEKLHRHFSRRGVTATAAMLASALSARGATGALPANLAAKISTASLARASAAGGLFSLWGRLLRGMVDNKAMMGAAIMATVAAIPLTMEYRKIQELNRQLAQKNAAMEQANLAALSPGSLLRGPFARLRRLVAQLSSMDAAQLEGLLEDIVKHPSRRENGAEIPLLAYRLVELGPQGAFNWAKELPGGDMRNRILQNVVEAWTELDPAATFRAADAIENFHLRDSLRYYAVAYMNLNSEDVLALLGTLSPLEQTGDIYAEFFRSWANRDPQAAATAALNLPLTRNRLRAISFAALGWAESDPQAALAWTATLNEDITEPTKEKMVAFLTQQDPQVGIKYISQVKDAGVRDKLTKLVATTWGEVEPQAALAWVEQFANGQTRDEAVSGLVVQIAQFDPVTATGLLAKIPAGPWHSQAIQGITHTWEMRDLTATLAWLRTLPASSSDENNPRQALLLDLFHYWASAAPRDAANYAETMTDDPDYGRIVQAVTTTWTSADPRGAWAWAQTLPMDIGGRTARRNVLTQYAIREPEAAWALAQDLPDAVREQTQVQILGKWSAKNPAQAAVALAEARLAESRRVDAIATLAKIWGQQDPTAASQWVNTLGPGPARDAAIVPLIALEGGNEPEAAFKWAASVGDETIRQAQMAQVITLWAKQDPAAATAAVNAAKVDEATHAALVALIGQAARARKN